MKNLPIISIILFFSLSIQAQKYVRGVVLEESKKGTFTPLIGAPVKWLGTSEGTITDTNGVFQINVPLPSGEGSGVRQMLIISYVGYKSDTIEVKGTSQARVILAEEGSNELQEIEISERINSSFVNALEPLNTKTMSEKELFKAACCNLSESFETNPSVDVSFQDAVSGAKQIQMLGLSGIYTQMTNENMPGTRGLAANYGMGYIPGPWIESIQVTKGAGSVANGYESMAGQINVELRKTDVSPKTGERVYANAYVNDFGRIEGNLNYTQKVGKKWGTTTLLHANGINNRVDQNKDHFYDIPLGYQVNGVNRWKYENNGWIVQFGVKALKDERRGGQYDLSLNNPTINPPVFNNKLYEIKLNTERLEGFTKIGYVFPQKKYASIGLMADVVQHKQDNLFGLNTYNAQQQTIYTNFIYQSIIGNTNHKFRTGLSNMIDKYDEKYNLVNYRRTEIVPGAFVEYTWTASPKLTAVFGLRGDYHNIFGFFATPRIHAKYDITEKTTIRVSAGRGQRTANIFGDNMNYMASSRVWQTVSNPNTIDQPTNALNIPSINTAAAYGLKPEVSWNYGISFSQEFKLDYRKGTIILDFYRTDFQNQVVVDLDYNPQKVLFYNLSGQSYSNSFQAEINYELIKRLDVRLAYRMFDVNTTYHGQLLERPYISRDRAFLNISYETKSKWKFDYTINWNGPKRLPNTSSNPVEYQRPGYSPSYFLMNAQISKSFGNPMKNWWDVYIGVENLTGYRQNQLIVASDAPFSQYFDASIVWGPIVGRMMYAGVRYKLK